MGPNVILPNSYDQDVIPEDLELLGQALSQGGLIIDMGSDDMEEPKEVDE